jgi:hypothetical protein
VNDRWWNVAIFETNEQRLVADPPQLINGETTVPGTPVPP